MIASPDADPVIRRFTLPWKPHGYLLGSRRFIMKGRQRFTRLDFARPHDLRDRKNTNLTAESGIDKGNGTIRGAEIDPDNKPRSINSLFHREH